MKKIKLIFMLLATVFTFAFVSVVNASAEGHEYTFTTDDKSTVNGTKYTLGDTTSYITTDVSDVELDVANLYVSVMYNFSRDTENFEIYYIGVKSDGTEEQAYGSVGINKNSSKGNPWNLKEQIVGDGYAISTFVLAGISAYTDVKSISIKINGSVGTTFDLYAFVITKDRQHGLDESYLPKVDEDELNSAKNTAIAELASYIGDYSSSINIDEYKSLINNAKSLESIATIVKESKVEIIKKQFKIDGLGLTSEDENVEINNNKITLSTNSTINVVMDVPNYTLDVKYVSIKYKATGISKMNLQGIGLEVDGSTKLNENFGNIISNGWNTTIDEYGDIHVANIKVDSYYIGKDSKTQEIIYTYESVSQLGLSIKGEEGSTLEILEFTYSTDGVHGFELPMIITDIKAPSDVNYSKNQNGEQVISYSQINQNSFSFNVLNYKENINNIFVFDFTASESVYLCLEINGKNYDHLLYTAGKHHLIFDLKDYNNPKTDFSIKLYIDSKYSASPEFTNTKTVTVHDYYITDQQEVSEVKVPAGVSYAINENGEQVISYSAKNSGYYKINVYNYEVNVNDVFVIDFTASADVWLRVKVNDETDWSIGHKKYIAGKHHLVFDLTKYGTLGENVVIYLNFDSNDSAAPDLTETKQVIVHSYDIVSDTVLSEITVPSLDYVTESRTENDEAVITYKKSLVWSTVNIGVFNFDSNKNVLKFVYSSKSEFTICFGYNNGSSIVLTDHDKYLPGEKVVVYVDYSVVEDSKFNIIMYVDSHSVETVEKSIIVNSYEFISQEDYLNEIQESAIAEIVEAIGEYNISLEGYETTIKAQETVDAVAEALEGILAEIETLKPVLDAKASAIDAIVKEIGEYNISTETYEATINSKGSIDDVNAALAEIITEVKGLIIIIDAKATAVAELEAYKSQVEYREEQQALVDDAKEAGETAINAAVSTDEVDAALAAAKAAIDLIKTHAQLTAEELAKAQENAIKEIVAAIGEYEIDSEAYAEEINACEVIEDVATALAAAKADIQDKIDAIEALKQAKVDAAKALDDLVVELNIANYREAEQKEINDLVAEGKETISACDSIAKVEEKLAKVETALRAIKTDAQLIAEEKAALEKAQKDAIDAITEAIGEYDLKVNNYTAGINAATTPELVQTALTAALQEVADDIAAIEAAIKALANAKAAAVEALNAHKVEDYRQEEKATFEAALAAGLDAIEAAETIEAVNTAKENALKVIAEIKTDADWKEEEANYAAALAKKIEEALDALEAYKANVEYRDTQAKEVADIKAAGAEAIKAITVTDEVQVKLNEIKALIDAVKTNEQLTAEEAAKALADAKKAAIEEIETLVGEYEISIETYVEQINAAAKIEKVNEVLNTAKTAIAAAKAEIDAAIALQNAKNQAKQALAAYKSADDYRAAEQALLATAISNGNEAIDASSNADAINAALAAAKTKIDAIKTKAAYEAEEAAALAKAKEEAIAAVITAIGTYAIDKAEYETAINACTTIDAVAAALVAAKSDIASKIADIEAAIAAAQALAAAKESAIMEVLVAIGTYSIDKAAYETQINAAKSLDEVATALAAAKSDIASKIADIEAAIALAQAKEDAIEEIADYIEDYEIDTTEYVTSINACTSVNDVTTVLAAIKAEIDEEKENIDEYYETAALESTNEEVLSINGKVVTLEVAQDTAIDTLENCDYVSIPVRRVDLTSTYVSVKFVGNIAGLGLHAKGVNTDGEVITSYIAEMIPTGWNVTIQKYRAYTILTAKVHSYFAEDNYAELNEVLFKFKGEAGQTFEVLDFAITTDGNHGFALPTELEFSEITSSSKVAEITTNEDYETTIKYTASNGWSSFKTSVINFNANNPILAVKFSADQEVTLCFASYVTAEKNLGHIKYAAGENQVIYLDYSKIPTAESFEIRIYIDAEVEVVEAKTLVIHSMNFVSVETALSEVKAATKVQLAAYKAAADYREAEQALLATAITDGNTAIEAATTFEEVNTALAAAKVVIDAIKTKATYEAEEAAALAQAKEDAIAAVVTAIGTYSIDKAEYETAINACTTVDAVAAALVAAKSNIEAKIEEIEAEIAAAEALAAAKESAVAEVLVAIGTYSIDKAAYETQINAATTLEEVAAALAAAKSNIASKIAEIDAQVAAAQALVNAKKDAISKVVSLIGEYQIDKTAYETAINACTTVEAVASELAKAETEIAAKKAEIDENNKQEIPTAPEEDPIVDEPESGCNGGCGGSLMPTLFGLIVLFGACLVLRKRKED